MRKAIGACLLVVVSVATTSIMASAQAPAPAAPAAPAAKKPAAKKPTPPNPSTISTAELVVSEALPYRQQVIKHGEILDRLAKVLAQARQSRATARSTKNFDAYLAAEQDEDNTIHALVPYSVAEEQARSLKNDKRKLKSIDPPAEGQVCNETGECAEVDPIVALFMLLFGALTDELNKNKPFGPSNELTKLFVSLSTFVNRPLGGPGSELGKIREVILFHDKNGEIAKLVRDPLQRPLKITQHIRDKVIDPRDRGEIAKAIRDPIKCTIGHLWKAC